MRTLARAFNLRLFRRVLARHDVSATEPEFETMYDILRGDEGTGADRNRVRRTLERAGIDIADLEEHFITHQAVHTYLTEGRGLSKVEREGRSPAKSRETIDRLRGRLTSVIESELRSLDNSPEFTFDDPDAIVTVTVNCKTCNAHMDLIEALASGGCDCA